MGNVYSMALFLNLSTHLPPAGVIPAFPPSGTGSVPLFPPCGLCPAGVGAGSPHRRCAMFMASRSQYYKVALGFPMKRELKLIFVALLFRSFYVAVGFLMKRESKPISIGNCKRV